MSGLISSSNSAASSGGKASDPVEALSLLVSVVLLEFPMLDKCATLLATLAAALATTDDVEKEIVAEWLRKVIVFRTYNPDRVRISQKLARQ